MAKPRWKSVAVIGVGLIGGSIGLALRKRRLAGEIIGIGRRTESLRIARRKGAVTRITTDLERGVATAEWIMVCTPVDLIAGLIARAAAACPASTLITDAGSVKAPIVAELDAKLNRSVRFVGSHPLAGSEERGPAAADAQLFEGRVAVVTPTRRAKEDDTLAVEAFWQSLGSEVVRMSPSQHDRAVAVTSHLPHLVAAAVSGSTAAKLLQLCSTGWGDTTRVAAGDAELWTQILLANRDEVLHAMKKVDDILDRFRGALVRRDAKKLRQLLSQAKRRRDALAD